MSPHANPIPAHLKLLWDHLINRTLVLESNPTSRVQHILDDMDLLLATLSDFIAMCLIKAREDDDKDTLVQMSLTLSEGIGVDRGSWCLRSEEQIPAKYRTLFAEKPGDKIPRVSRHEKNKEVSTFEQTFATFNEVSVIKKEEARGDDHDGGGGDDEEGGGGELDEETGEIKNEEGMMASSSSSRKRKSVPEKECKLDFQIVDKLFVCKAPNCSATEGFHTLPLLKSHYDECHANDPNVVTTQQRPSKFLARRSISPSAAASSDQSSSPAAKEEKKVSSVKREVIITPSGQKYVWQRKSYVRTKKPRPPVIREPKQPAHAEGGGDGGDSSSSQQQDLPGAIPQAILETLNMPRRHLLQCHVCDFTCRNQLDLESHTKTQHPGVDPYKCEECDFTASEKKFLISHKRSKHLLEFRCNVCDHRFGYKNHLETHMASHSTENTVMCHLCGKGFKCTKYLRKHLRFTHAEQNAYLCGQCGRSFKHQSSYETHLKSKHQALAHSLNLMGQDDDM